MMKMLEHSFIIMALVGCLASAAQADDELPPLGNAITASIGRALDWPPAPRQTVVQTFYEERGFTPLWVDETGFRPEAEALLKELADADAWGLSGRQYAVERPRDISDESLADAEIRLTFAILDYVTDARGGRITEPSKQLSSYLDRQPNLAEPLAVLRAFGTSQNPVATLLSYHPQHEQFGRLRAAYLKIKGDSKRIRDAAVAMTGPSLRKGMDDPEVAVLKKRFGLASTSTLFDDELEAAVRRFQKEQGQRRVDGIVGNRTRRALNTVDTSKLETLRANMEQWRWMPADLGADHVLVNIPEFKVELIRDGEVAFSERVIVGKATTQTPVFSDRMQTVVLHPRWYVPESIKIKEFLPSLLRGRSLESRGFVLSRNGKEISSWRVNWSKADIRQYDVYQASGDDNALGQVKFLFPNQHAVYLHDTPKRYLFNSTVRTFSHGCVRVRNPLKFAKLLLNDDKGWSEQHVREIASNGPLDNAITLNTTVPVHITYFTTWVDDDGTLRTMRDIYGHEKRIKLALDGRWSEIDKGKDHLAPVTMADIPRVQQRRTSTRRRPVAVSSTWGAPMGLFGSSSASPRRPSGQSSNDIFRRAFGF